MNRSTLIMLVLFVVLLGAWLISQRPATSEGPPPLAVEGFVEGVSFQDIKILNKDEDSPYTKFIVERQGSKVVMELQPGQEKVKAGEKKWKAVHTDADGEKLETWGQAYRVRLWNQALALSFRSSYSFEATDAELAEYGLAPDNAVTFIAEGAGRTVKLTVGKVDKTGEGDTDATTWVMNPEVPKVVYQVAGRDLRTELAAPWKDIRERKLFEWKLPEVDRIELVNPKDTRTAKVVMTRPPLTAEQKKKLAEGPKDKDAKDAKDPKDPKADKDDKEIRKASEGWMIAEPTGYPPGDIGDWLESLERMQATDYRPFKDGKLPPDSGLGKDKGVRVTVSGGGKSDTFIIGGKGDNKDGDVWVQVEGRTELYLVASWSTDQCIKSLDGVRDLRLLGAGKSSKSSYLIANGVKGSLKMTRKDGKWDAGKAEIDAKKIDDFFSDLDGVRVEYDSARTRAAAGLDKPEYTYEFEVEGKATRLQVGAKQGEDTYGALGDGDVFKFQSWNADRLRKGPNDFADKHLVEFDKGEVKGLSIEPPDGKPVPMNKGPDGKWQVTGKPDIKLKDPALEGILAAVVEINYDAKIPSRKLAEFGLDKGYHSITFNLNLGRKVQVRVSAKEQDGKPYVSVHKQGKLVQIGVIASMNAGSLKKTLDDLKG